MEHYRELLEITTDPARRRNIEKLLLDEEAKLKNTTQKYDAENTTMVTTRNNIAQMTRALLLASSIALLAPLLASGLIRAQPMDQPKRGLILAQQICAQCHAVEAGTLNSPNAAAPRFEDIANIPGMTATAISATLHTSHRTMPNVMLDSDQTGNIVAYFLSLKRAAR